MMMAPVMLAAQPGADAVMFAGRTMTAVMVVAAVNTPASVYSRTTVVPGPVGVL